MEILKSVEILGVTGTADALKLIRSNNLTFQDKTVDFVLKMVSNHYLLTIDEIINSRSKSIKRMLALKFSIYYLFDVFHYSLGDLNILFKRDKSQLSRSSKELKEMFGRSMAIKNIKDKFDLMISDYKTKNEL